MTNPFFTEDSYVTPQGRECLLHKLVFRSRIYYILKFMGVVFGYWPAARKGGLDMETWRRSSLDVFKIMEDCGGRFFIKGLFNLQKTESPVVFVANHMSTMETVVLTSMIVPRKKPVFIIKEQLLHIPFFGKYATQCIAVRRKSPSEDFKQVMTEGAATISEGKSVIVFPQSTRSDTFVPSKFNTLGIKLAKRNNVPVIPIAIKTDFWSTGKVLKDFGPLDMNKTIHFEFGSPIHIEGSGKKEHEQVVSFIRSRMEKWEEK